LGQTAYPSRPVRILVPFLPGGGADLIARLISPRLQQLFGQSFFVENRAGAAGRIGTGVAAKSDPDGHTLLMTTESSLVIAPHIGVSLGYDPRKDFAPVSLLTRNAVVLVASVRSGRHARRLYSRSRAASPGSCSCLLRGGRSQSPRRRDLQPDGRHEIVHVPFPARAEPSGCDRKPSRCDVGLHRRIDPAHPRRRARASPSAARSAAGLARVPTVAEAGVAGYEATSWIGLLAPGTTAPAVIDKLWQGVSAAMRDPEVRDVLLRDGSDIVASTPQDFHEAIDNDYAKYGKLADLLRAAK
jgi:tripartite-type tricarboxylate transporter receptor subunit TctC